jgi:DNA polymerase-1
MRKYPEVDTVDKFTKEEKVTVDEGAIKLIWENHKHPLAVDLLALRKATKRKSTYIDIMAEGSPDLWPDGCLHAIFNTTFAETGRLSCEAPNLQNFPKRDDEAKEVRRPLKSPPKHLIFSVDYGQIEARVIAMYTHDKRFCDALWNNGDVHGEWAQRLAKAYPERVGGVAFLEDKAALKAFRTDIKNQWTFPLFFGASLKSASNFISIPERVLEPHYEAFWEEFSGVKAWQEDLMTFYRANGYVETLIGRRRRGPLSINKVCNSPVQSLAADIVMDAMCRLSETGDPELQCEVQIHDDLTFFRVLEDRIGIVAEKVIEIMLDVPFEWARVVPITVEASYGTSWDKMESCGTYTSSWKRGYV